MKETGEVTRTRNVKRNESPDLKKKEVWVFQNLDGVKRGQREEETVIAEIFF